MKGADYTWGCGCYSFCGNLIACPQHSPWPSSCDTLWDTDPAPVEDHIEQSRRLRTAIREVKAKEKA